MWNLISIVAPIGAFLNSLLGDKIKACLVDLIEEKIGVVPRIQEYFGYVIDYDSNMKTLKTEVDKLAEIKDEAQKSVDKASNNGQVIEPGLNSLLTKADQTNEEVKKILEDEVGVNKRWLGGWCPGLISRYNLSKEAKTKTQHVRELQEVINRLTIVDFESRMSIMKNIMAALKDDDIHVIGICGSGGVGKTITVQKIRQRAEAEKLFDESVMVVVSQNQGKEKIQEVIGEDLELAFNMKDFYRRANALRERLKNGKRVLIILDDVWEPLKLEEIGIGGVYKGCKVLLTSRSIDACNMTETHRIFEIPVLPDQDAWNLFKQKAGNSIDSPDLYHIAKRVVKECGGLPIALVIIGAALKGKHVDIWRDTLLQLKMSKPENILGLRKEVYESIKLSYDFLQSPEAKSCLLLCCLFKEDSDIEVEDLVRYGRGLPLCEGNYTLVQTRNRVHTLIAMLKGFYLLLDSCREGCVRVHDVVRDAIRCIATEGEEVFKFGDGRELKEFPINIMRTDELSMDCPKLELLLLRCMGESREVPGSLFEGMKELKVLNLRLVKSPSLSFLTELRTLCLHSCQLEDISTIGQLKALVILSFQNSSIKELPQEIGSLTHLRLLDLTGCRDIETVTPTVILSLEKLEELYLRNSGLRWVVEEEEGNAKNKVNLNELLSLSKLTTLETCLPTTKFSHVINPFGKLERFGIVIDPGENWNWHRENEFQNELKLNLEAGIPVDNWINVLLEKTKTLHLTLKGMQNVLDGQQLAHSFCNLRVLRVVKCKELLVVPLNWLPGLQKLEVLSIKDCASLVEVIEVEGLNVEERDAVLLPMLQELRLERLPKLKHLFNKKLLFPTCLFANLKFLSVENCGDLRNLFSPSMARALVNLEDLSIANCEMMEEIVVKGENEEADKMDKIVIPQLKSLELYSLPNLTSFCRSPYAFDLPLLDNVLVNNCPKMKAFSLGNPSTPKLQNVKGVWLGDLNNTIQELFERERNIVFPSLEELRLECEDNVEGILHGQPLAHSFCNLRVLRVVKCKELLVVPSNWLPAGLQNVEVLWIEDCDSLVEVFEVEGLNVEERDVVLLPKLEELHLRFLPKLKHLFNEKHLFPTCLFPNLKLLEVWMCGNLRNLFSPSVARALVHLQHLFIKKCTMMEEIVVKGENEEADKTDKIIIPQLQRLQLYSLPNLTSFCQSPYAFDLPLLEYVRVNNCPKMKAFSMGNVSTPKLQEVKGDWMGDLNNPIQELLGRERKKLEVNQEIGQEEHLVKESEVNQEIEQEKHLVKELEVNQEVGHEEHLDNNDDDHEN